MLRRRASEKKTEPVTIYKFILICSWLMIIQLVFKAFAVVEDNGIFQSTRQMFFFQTLAWNRTLDSSSVYGKVSAQPNTIVKQICFPNGNVLFLSLFSLFKNWMHNVGWGCAEILPSLQMFLSKIWHHLKNVFAIRFFDFVSLSFSSRRIEYSMLCLTDLSLNCFLWRCENKEEIVLERAIKLVTRYIWVSLFIVHCRALAEFSKEVSNTWPRRAEETFSSVYKQRLVREGLVNSHISLTDKLMTRRNIKCIHK